MPRAFLITHRRYNASAEGEQRESSPEHKVTLPESSLLYLTSRAMSPSPTDCPDELYNLTKLAEVSLAAASGQLYHHRHLSTIPFSPPTTNYPHSVSSSYPHPSLSPIPTTQGNTAPTITYTHKLFDRDRDRSSSGSPKSGDDGRDDRQLENEKQNSGEGQDQLPQHECPDCGKKYSTSSNLARHRQTHRSLADKKARRCPHCDKVYVSMPAYSMHVRTHVQGCRCPYCGKCFSRPWLLQGHIRTHTGEKPFRCPQCQKAFADKSNLRAHVQTHSDTKPHVCSRCGKAFALKSYLYKHEESSCMRHSLQGGQSGGQSQQNGQSMPLQSFSYAGSKNAVPTPVIVRNSVISAPSAEKLVHGEIGKPVPTVMAGRCCVPLPLPVKIREEPVDFSKREYNEKRRDYGGMAIAV